MLLALFTLTNSAYAATDEFNVGEYVQFGHFNDSPIVWQVIHKDEKGNPMLFSDKVITLKAFDAPGNAYSNETRRLYGSNEWEHSTLRRWLNSRALEIEWLNNKPSLENMVNGNAYDNEAGFLSSRNFSIPERNAILPVNHSVLLADMDSMKNDGGTKTLGKTFIDPDADGYRRNVRDTVFLLSIKEFSNYIEKNEFEMMGFVTPEVMEKYEGSINIKNGSYISDYWLRSPNYSDYSSVQAVLFGEHYDDYRTSRGAWSDLCGVRPAMYIEHSKVERSTGSGSKEDPFVVTAKLSNGPRTPEFEVLLDKSFITLEKDESLEIKLKTEDPLVTLKFSSEQPTIVTVSTDGEVFAKNYGAAAINVTATKNGYLQATQKVLVYVKEPGIKVDKYIYYGRYYGEPILWQVVNIDDKGNPLLLSKHVLTLKALDTIDNWRSASPKENVWKDSTLRQWLNASGVISTWKNPSPSTENVSRGFNPYEQEIGFLSTEHFTPQESSAMVRTKLSGENTIDKMFLLSLTEVKEYLSSKEKRVYAKPTVEAVSNSTTDYYWISSSRNIRYWLRSVNILYDMDIVDADGMGFTPFGSAISNYGDVGVRPAFYLDLSKVKFESGAGYSTYPYFLEVK